MHFVQTSEQTDVSMRPNISRCASRGQRKRRHIRAVSRARVRNRYTDPSARRPYTQHLGGRKRRMDVTHRLHVITACSAWIRLELNPEEMNRGRPPDAKWRPAGADRRDGCTVRCGGSADGTSRRRASRSARLVARCGDVPCAGARHGDTRHGECQNRTMAVSDPEMPGAATARASGLTRYDSFSALRTSARSSSREPKPTPPPASSTK